MLPMASLGIYRWFAGGPGDGARRGTILQHQNAPAPTGRRDIFSVQAERLPFNAAYSVRGTSVRYDRPKQQARLDQRAIPGAARSCRRPRREFRADAAGVPRRAAGGAKDAVEAE